MEIDLTIKNYRCFPRERPARLLLRKGSTAFIGVNNAGKSTLLKFFYEFRSLFAMLASMPSSNQVVQALGGVSQSPNLQGVAEPIEVFHNGNDGDVEIQLKLSKNDGSDGYPALEKNIQLDIIFSREELQWLTRLEVAGDQWKGESYTLNNTILTAPPHPDIDLARLLAACQDLTNTFYFPAYRYTISGTIPQTYDTTIGSQVFSTWDQMKRGTGAGSSAQYNRYLAVINTLKDIFAFEDLDIDVAQPGDTLFVRIEGQRYALKDLGIGFSQFLFVLLNVATRQLAYVLIDEPELNLHPALQQTFMQTLESFASGGVLFATHSLGLAQTIAPWIYSVRRLRQGVSEVVPYEKTPELPEFLGEMSFSAYQELGYEKLLLVEGITDRKALEYFLRLFRKNHRVVMLPLGGSQMITGNRAAELQETKRICPQVHVLIDSERAAAEAPLSPDRQAFVDTCKKVKIPCTVMERRAIENYFPEHAIQAEFGANYRALEPYDLLKEAPLAWGKADNWRIAQHMTKDELANTDLGKFLAEL